MLFNYYTTNIFKEINYYIFIFEDICLQFLFVQSKHAHIESKNLLQNVYIRRTTYIKSVNILTNS